MKAKSFMLLFTIALLLGTILTGICSAQEPTNYLKVKGKVIGSDATDIQVFEYNEVNGEWNEIHRKVKKSKYFLRLSTSKEYKVFFTADNGYIKALHVHSGEAGMWIKMLDVDFTKTGNMHASMYQNDALDDYTVELMHRNYASLE